MKICSAIFVAIFGIFFVGCATVGMPNESKENDAIAKQFAKPTDQKANLYLYRPSSWGANAKIDLDVNGKRIGSLTGSEFVLLKGLKPGQTGIMGSTNLQRTGENCLVEIDLKANENNYVLVQIQSGWWSHGCELSVTQDEVKAQKDIKKSDLVKSFYKE